MNAPLLVALLVSAAFAVVGGVEGQGLAAGWSKAHADLRNSNVHPTAAGLRSLQHTELVLLEIINAVGPAAHDEQGNSFYAGGATLFHRDLLNEGVANDFKLKKYYQAGHPAVTDDGKVVLLNMESLEMVDLATGEMKLTEWSSSGWTLFGSSVTVVDGLIYALNSDAELVVYDFELEEQARNNATAEIWGGGNFVEFVTPATDGKGVFYFVTETPEADAKALAIRFPENEVVWSKSLGEGNHFPSVADYVAGGSPSLSEDGRRLFVVFERGGVMALNTENGEVEWATSITDLQEGDYYNDKQVPTISPVDGSIITFWQEQQSKSLVVVALSANTGEEVNFLQFLDGQVEPNSSEGPGVSSVDGVFYACVYGNVVAVDLEKFEVLWNYTIWRDHSMGRSPSIAVDGGIYSPLASSVLRCKENYTLNANGECSDECAHPKARFIGRNMCGFDCGTSTALLHPLLANETVCTACEANQYWSTEELLCLSCPEGRNSPAGSIGEDACVEETSSSTSGTEDGANSSGSSALLPSFFHLLGRSSSKGSQRCCPF
ncbi:hypothetical protein QOT17_016748 [Balamuthia mandrillaris]